MSVDRLSTRSGGVIGTIGPIRGSGVFSLQERYALTADNYEDVSLYLKMNGPSGSTTFYDSSLYGHTVTANGNAQISTTQSKFGGASAAFDGTGDYLTVPSSSAFDWSGDTTIEAWIYVTSLSYRVVICTTSSSFSDGKTGCLIYDDGRISISKVGVSEVVSVSSAISINIWHHVAFIKTSTTALIFVDGVQVASGPASNCWSTGAEPFKIASSSQENSDFPGYIDDLRITKGVARWTGNYTPPQREFLP